MQWRKLNYRPTFDLHPEGEEVTVNYFPVNSAISYTCNNHWVTVLNDRSMGGSVLGNGVIELMI